MFFNFFVKLVIYSNQNAIIEKLLRMLVRTLSRTYVCLMSAMKLNNETPKIQNETKDM